VQQIARARVLVPLHEQEWGDATATGHPLRRRIRLAVAALMPTAVAI
jgi:hypothetical protein